MSSLPAPSGAESPTAHHPYHHGAPPVPRTKRVKIDIACNHCRDRKVKCDGTRPACKHCIRRRDRCDYAPSVASSSHAAHLPSHSTNYDTLHRTPSVSAASPAAISRQPLHGLRPSSDLAGFVPVSSPRATSHPTRGGIPSLLSGQSPQSISGPHGGPSPLSTLSIAASQHANSSAAADSMTAVLNDGEVSNEYFGSSSVGSFTRQLRAAVSGATSAGHNQQQHHQEHGRPPQSIFAPPASPARQRPSIGGRSAFIPVFGIRSDVKHKDDANTEPHDYVLPSRKQADRLVHVYWYYVDGLYPFLDRETFQACYESLFTGSFSSADPSEPPATMSIADERVFVSLLNTIFALAIELSEGYPSEQRADASKEYFARAQQSLQFNVWEGGSVQVVQCLLLMGQYLQSTHHPNQTWMVVGAAIRIAQGLGLHLPETSARLGDLRDRELARRIWHGCVLMDRMLALTHGRPSMISSATAEAVPLPLIEDVTAALDQNATKGTGSNSNAAHSTYRYAFYVKTLDLYRIIHGVLRAFYSTPNTNSRGLESHRAEWLETDQGEADAGKAIVIDHELSRWEAELPAHLKLEALEENNSGGRALMVDEITRRQTVILRFRCLHTRVLLLRPMLARYCLGQGDNGSLDSHTTVPAKKPTLSTRVLQQSALVCIETAIETVALMRRFMQHDGTLGLLPAWWYRLFYVYTAGAVLMAARLRPKCFPAEEVSAALEETMAILREHEQFGLAAKRCVVALEILSGKISEKTSGSRVGSQGRSAEQPQCQQPDETRERQEMQHGTSTYQGPNVGVLDGRQPPLMAQPRAGATLHHSHNYNMASSSMFDVAGATAGGDAGLDSLFFDMDDTQWLTYVPADL